MIHSGGTQVGHLPRNVVSNLAPLLDARRVTIEGVMLDGNRTSFRTMSLALSLNHALYQSVAGQVSGTSLCLYSLLPIPSYWLILHRKIKIYGPSDKTDELEQRLRWAMPAGPSKKRTAAAAATPSGSRYQPPPPSFPTPSQRGPAQTPEQMERIRKEQEALQKAAELREMLNTLEKVNDEGRRSSLLDTLCSVDDVLALPVYKDPPGPTKGDLTVELLKHQVSAS